MDCSAASQYENVSKVPKNYSETVLYETIDNVLSAAGAASLFCPLCVDVYEFKFSLMDHLRSCHNNFLMQTADKNVEFLQCPFCYAKFYGKHLTTKHALLSHSKVIAELYVDKTTKKCMFCEQKFKKRSYCKFSVHIGEHHFLDFEKAFQHQFLYSDESKNFTANNTVDCSMEEQSSTILSDSLNIIHHITKDFVEASKMNCYDFSELKEQLDNIKGRKKLSDTKSILKNRPVNDISFPSQKSTVRRVLRFDLPGSSAEEDKENSVLSQNMSIFEMTLADHSLLCQNKIDQFWSVKPKHCSTPNDTSKTQGKQKPFASHKSSGFKSYIKNNDSVLGGYQCGKCSQVFFENRELVSHVKKKHNRFTLNLLQPCYKCAICEARFFKNNYLRRHCKLHSSQLVKKLI